MSKNFRKHTYYVKGMHCASCEILIENKLLTLKGIKSAKASTAKGLVVVEYEDKRPILKTLNEIFKKEGYTFFEQPIKVITDLKIKEFIIIFGWTLLIIGIFILLDRMGLSRFINIDASSSLPIFFLFGFFAAVSSCGALVGSLVLSMAKQWHQLYENASTWQRLKPHLIFNLGRLASYGIFGAILGTIGNRFHFSFAFGPVFVIVISIIMILLALQMLGFETLKKFHLRMPKSVIKFISNESNFKGRYMPFILGAATFFLPCGLTIAAQGLALISSNALQGALIMTSFALGTFPMLLLIGLSSVKFLQKPHLAEKFSKIAGILVLFFAFYNINSQLNLLGIFSLNDFRINFGPFFKVIKNDTFENKNEAGLAPLINGQQILKMEASYYGYEPNYFKVKVGVPVRWEITDKGTSGCTNAIISKNLFKDPILLTPGKVSTKEFTPEKPGKYKFSCWMGMVSGIIEVID